MNFLHDHTLAMDICGALGLDPMKVASIDMSLHAGGGAASVTVRQLVTTDNSVGEVLRKYQLVPTGLTLPAPPLPPMTNDAVILAAKVSNLTADLIKACLPERFTPETRRLFVDVLVHTEAMLQRRA